jgi:hypothetical protein
MSPGPDQEPISDLKRLAHERFGNLTAAEIKLLDSAPKGEPAVCGPSFDDEDPANDPAQAESWGPDRQIRPDLIRWLCVDRQAKELVDPKGIQVLGAKITVVLDLDLVAVPFPLTLWQCRLMDHLILLHAEIPQLNLQGTWLHSLPADGCRVKGDVFLRNGFHAEGEVRLVGAEIGGTLDCGGGTFNNPPRAGEEAGGPALNAERAVVKGGVFLRGGFSAEGAVRLLGAQIQGNLDCSGGTFKNPPQAGVETSGNALSADGALVRSDVVLRNGFSAEGAVRLLGAQIDGDLSCIGAIFRGALIAERASIKGALFWTRLVNPERARLNLMNASAGALCDDERSWPSKGNLWLDGFVYGRISFGPRDARSRLDWLARQNSFAPQPYRQLAKVLKEEGDDRGARKVLFEMEHRRREVEDHSFIQKAWSLILRCTVGYGYYPAKALKWLVVLALAGFFLFWVGYSGRSIVPTDKDAYACFRKDRQLPPHYERFHASMYSLENSFPLIKLGQVDRWQPDPNPQRSTSQAGEWMARHAPCISFAGILRWFRWLQIIFGWVLATLGIAAVTGLVRKE